MLVVEDGPPVRQLGVEALTALGYRVLAAEGASSALRLRDALPEIDVLLTDVVMPEVNGARLVEEARRRRSDLEAFFTMAARATPSRTLVRSIQAWSCSASRSPSGSR